tara:strand:- start:1376 stop:1678 length:303 start_codon:yes stop_codon:yes gene_type:complete
MKIYTKIILDKNNNLIEEEYINYEGNISQCGIHYSYKNEKPKKAMEKQARREKKLKERREKKQAKAIEKGIQIKENEEDKTLPIDTIITLDHLTSPDEKK